MQKESGGQKLFSDMVHHKMKMSERTVTDEMIQAACVAGYGVDTDKDSNLYALMKRALTAALSAAAQ